MAKKRLNAAEVLTLLDSDEECDDSDEVMAEDGSQMSYPCPTGFLAASPSR